MSIWDGIKSFGGFLKEQMNERQARILEYKQRYEDEPDDQRLIRMYHSASTIEKKLGIGLVLKERGYNKTDLEG